MAVDADFIHELFAEFGPVQVRRMFGGAGLYADGVMFGLATGGVIYLKADETSQPAFAQENCAPFSFPTKTGRHTITSYWRMPERLYDDPEELARWAKQALQIARQKKSAPKPVRKKKTRR